MKPSRASTGVPDLIERQYKRLRWAYFINATLLVCHEIDSACWREWELFQIPGGAPVFVALHLLVVPLILVGLIQIIQQRPASRWTSLLIGGLGALGSIIHGAFLLSGDAHFATGFSTALVLAFGLSSAFLIAAGLSGWRVFS